MCGLAGIVACGEDRPTREAGLAMARRLEHRGPDGQAAWASPDRRCVLAHARLKVIDLVTGDQPMTNHDGTVHVVFNGEIYNFQTLRGALESAGHRFVTRSDTEVLVHGYKEWGESLLDRIDGMFALAIWDQERHTLLLARDRAGKKPLFWARVGDQLAFASEVKALLALDWIPDEIDPDAFLPYLAYGYVPSPRTFYRHIHILPPASRLRVRARGERALEVDGPHRFWRLDWRSENVDAESAQRRVRALLGEAVERRLVADVPLGAFLSGGIDSTLIVGLMRERMEGRIKTFSLGFADDPTYDETRFARIAAERYDTDHTEFIVEASSVDLVDDLVRAYDQPFGDSSAIPTHIVSRLTKEHVTVALTGDGGDEMFGGYVRFLGMAIAERMPRLVAAVGNTLGGLLPYNPDFRHPTRRFSRFFEAAALPAEERMLRWIGFFPEAEQWLVEPEAQSDREALLQSFREPWQRAEGQSGFTRALALNFETYLPEDLLVKADRCSMSHGLELRSPFLDTAVMEFAATLPDGLRARGGRPGTLKWLLRQTFPDLLPASVADRPKMGFGIPLPTWLRNQWRLFFEGRVLSRDARIFQWIRRDRVDGLWKEHQSGQVDHGHKLWALLTLETWLRQR